MSDTEEKKYEKGNHYSEFSKDEFKGPYTIERLCKAIRMDHYGFSLTSSDNSIFRLNEILTCLDLYIKIVGKIDDSILPNNDIHYLFHSIRPYIRDGITFAELNPNTQIDVKRLNRLFLEETYPKETPKSSKYFIPPGLIGAVDTFEYHCKIANGEPILIIGETGVGKSLFLHIFERLYREEHENDIRHPIVKVNCAHFGGDPNMCQRSFQSEPFSVVKSEPPCPRDWLISTPSFPTFPRSL